MRKLTINAILLLVSLPVVAQDKKRVAVLDFNYGTVKSSVQAIFGTNQDIGKGISDLLIDKLVNDGTYRVIERDAMSKIVAEQNFSNSNRVDSNSAARIGKILGVDAIIIGDITQFGRDDQNTNVGGAGAALGRYGLGGLGIHKAKGSVSITARLVDVNTGEILASATGAGSSQRSGTNLLGGSASGSGAGGGRVDMGSANFSQTIIGEAVKSAITSLASSLDADAAKLPTVAVALPPPPSPVSGLVADVSGKELVLNVGSTEGVKVGDTLAIVRVGRVIPDPKTGRPLRSIEVSVGSVSITNVDASSAVGNFEGTGTVKVGDTVKSK